LCATFFSSVKPDGAAAAVAAAVAATAVTATPAFPADAAAAVAVVWLLSRRPFGEEFDPRCPAVCLRWASGGVVGSTAALSTTLSFRSQSSMLPPAGVAAAVGVASASERRSQSAFRAGWALVVAAPVVLGTPPWPGVRPVTVDGSASMSDSWSSSCSAAAAREPRKRRSPLPPPAFAPPLLLPPPPRPLWDGPFAPPVPLSLPWRGQGTVGADAGPSSDVVCVKGAFHRQRSLVGSLPTPRLDRGARRGTRLPDFANRSLSILAADTSAAAALAAAAVAALAFFLDLTLDSRKKRRGDCKMPSSIAAQSLPSRRLPTGKLAWRSWSTSPALSATVSLGPIRPAASVRAACMAAAGARRRLTVARRLSWSRCVRSLVA